MGALRYIVVGLAFGLVWAAMQAVRGETSEPVTLVAAVVICGLFGAVLWAIRSLVLRLRRGGGV